MPTYTITKPYTVISKPIIFNAENVRAILKGIKTQTRRVIKVKWSRCLDFDEPGDIQKAIAQSPYGNPGDLLWVRETFRETQEQPGIMYRADGWEDVKADYHLKWTPSIHMPRWASRITLEITDIEVKRLKSISLQDIQAEGVRNSGNMFEEFHKLWDSINQARGFGWDKNPWCWCISFRRIDYEPKKLS